MEQTEINELHKMLEMYAKDKGWSRPKVLGFLSAVFVGTMKMQGYSQEFMDATCDRMKERFKNIEFEVSDE